MISSYAHSGSAAFNRQLHIALRSIATDVQARLGSNLVALLLGGGYGRGEGACVIVDGQERPYNDLDLFVVVRHKWRLGSDPLARVSEIHGRRLGIDVDFSRPLTLGELSHLPRHLRWQDLLHGHVVVHGPPDILTAHAPSALTRPLPPIEASRLLINRGAGLLWALRVTAGLEPDPEPGFVRRNFEKCRLALGDALLIAYRRFVSSCRGRAQALAKLEVDEPGVAALSLLPTYRSAIAFKLDPGGAALAPPISVDAEQAELRTRWARSFLHVEQRRTGRAWPDLWGYGRWPGLREPALSAPPWRWGPNLALNLRLGRLGLCYPREAVYRELALLLAGPPASTPRWGPRSRELLRLWRWVN